MRITSTLFRGTAANVAQTATKFWVPHMDEARIIAEDISYMARRRKDTRYALFDLQLYLVNAIRPELLTLRALREERKTAELDKDLFRAEQMTRSTLNALEQIANGIAYRFFEYNHSLIQSLQGKQNSLFNILSDGFFNSTEVAATYNDSPVIDRQILLTDITGMIGLGDFVVKDQEAFEIVEVKGGTNASGRKVRRQKSKMKEAVDFINLGKGRIDDDEISAFSAPARKHHLHVLREALEEADQEGLSVRHVNSCVSLGVLSLNKIDDAALNEKINEVISKVLNGRSEANAWVIPSAYSRDKSGITAPFSIYPISSRHVVELLLGSKIAFFCLDHLAMEEKFKSAGWNVARSPNAFGESDAPLPKNNFDVYGLWKGTSFERNLMVPIDVLYSCAVELIDIESYIEILKIMWDKASDGRKVKWTCFHEDESHLWD